MARTPGWPADLNRERAPPGGCGGCSIECHQTLPIFGIPAAGACRRSPSWSGLRVRPLGPATEGETALLSAVACHPVGWTSCSLRGALSTYLRPTTRRTAPFPYIPGVLTTDRPGSTGVLCRPLWMSWTARSVSSSGVVASIRSPIPARCGCWCATWSRTTPSVRWPRRCRRSVIRSPSSVTCWTGWPGSARCSDTSTIPRSRRSGSTSPRQDYCSPKAYCTSSVRAESAAAPRTRSVRLAEPARVRSSAEGQRCE